MPEPKLKKAKLVELDRQLKDPRPGGKELDVQFNPESLKLTFATQVQNNASGQGTGGGAGDQRDSGAPLLVGRGTTKLAVQLWFDAGSPIAPGKGGCDDVRQLTQQVAYFITPIETQSGSTKQYVAPGVRFFWGTFKFDGVMEGLEETIDLFSPEGKPLRASLSFTLTQQNILSSKDIGAAGSRPIIAAPEGSTMQGIAATQANTTNWQPIAAANGIEDPLRLTPGQLVDLTRRLIAR